MHGERGQRAVDSCNNCERVGGLEMWIDDCHASRGDIHPTNSLRSGVLARIYFFIPAISPVLSKKWHEEEPVLVKCSTPLLTNLSIGFLSFGMM